MKRTGITITGLLLAWSVAFPSGVLGEPVHRPVEEMRGGCANYTMDVRAELAAMEGSPLGVTAWPSRTDVPPLGPAWQPLLVTLPPAPPGPSAVTPARAGANVGGLAFSVSKAGRYRISVNRPAGIDVVSAQTRIEPERFEMQTGCAKLFTTVGYRLDAGVRYWLELSSNDREIVLMLTAEGR